MSPEAFR